MQEIKQGIAGMALFVAITLVFFFIADLQERLRESDRTFSWWINRQIHRVIP
jgi:hypothetical protein